MCIYSLSVAAAVTRKFVACVGSIYIYILQFKQPITSKFDILLWKCVSTMEHLKFVSGLLFICQKTFLSLRCAVDFVKKKPSSTTRASPPAVVSWPVKNNLDTVQALTILKLNFGTIHMHKIQQSYKGLLHHKNHQILRNTFWNCHFRQHVPTCHKNCHL